MATGRNLHQPSKQLCELVPIGESRRTLEIPLLPYERELIELLGCSEDEYRRFAEEARRRGRTRPAGYEHIPDIRCDPVITPILINLAIGIALTAVSMLLAPKPGAPGQEKQGSQRRLANKKGSSRFNPTYGFETVANITSYGEPIPVPFGFYEGDFNPGAIEGSFHGGLVVTPKLLWSRMLSYGTHQAIKAMYVIGEANMGTPSASGVWLGTSPLDGVYSSQYALYWSTEKSSGRIKGSDLRDGTRGTSSSADTWGGDEVFVCPTSLGANDRGFCMASTPSAQTAFGAYNAICNGTDRRLNWRVISIPESTGADSQKKLIEERYKIADNDMDGVGQAYSRLMGVIEVNGSRSSIRRLVRTSLGQTAVFCISGFNYTNPFQYDVDIEDLIQESNQERIRADQLMQLGEKVMIGQVMYQVISRPNEIWQEGRYIYIELKCINTLGDKTVGQIPEGMLTRTRINAGGNDRDNTNHIQANFYPVLAAEIAVVKNSRTCDVTEIGIKSQVWGRMNGLCNFSGIPTAKELKEFDDDNVSVTNGTMNLYFPRHSYFAVQVRPADTSDQASWYDIGEKFCVRGASPIDQYNYIRISPSTPGRWEYRFVPLSSAYISRLPTNMDGWLLDSTNEQLLQSNYSTPYGSFGVTASGRYVNLLSTERVELMLSKGTPGAPPSYENRVVPNALSLSYWSPDVAGKSHAWRYEILGNPQSYGNGHYGQTAVTMTGTNGKTLRVFIQSNVVQLGGTNRWGQTKVWAPHSYRVNQTHPDTINGGNWQSGESATYQAQLSGGNPYKVAGAISAVHSVSVSNFPVYIPGTPGSDERAFENDTGIAEVGHYGDLITRSCDSSPEHSIAYVNESVAYAEGNIPNYSDLTTMGLVLRASRNFTQLDQPRAWVRRGIKVDRLMHPNDSNLVSSSNFADVAWWILTDKRAGMGDYISEDLVDKEEMQLAGRYCRVNEMYFDGAIEDRSNVRQLLSDLAPKFLCNFVISNGRFSLIPALPCDENGNAKDHATPIAAMFSAGNIIEDTLEFTYLDAEERRDIQAVISYRINRHQQLPEERNIRVRSRDTGNVAPENPIDMSEFCTSKKHAEKVGRYFLALRKHVDHTVSFKTTPDGLSLGPGKYIKIFTEANPYASAANGIVRDDGFVISALRLGDGVYDVLMFALGSEEVVETTLTIENGKATDTSQAGSIFTLRSSGIQENVYLVEQLTLNEDGLVEITASHFPVNANGVSLITNDVFNDSAFVTLP